MRMYNAINKGKGKKNCGRKIAKRTHGVYLHIRFNAIRKRIDGKRRYEIFIDSSFDISFCVCVLFLGSKILKKELLFSSDAFFVLSARKGFFLPLFIEFLFLSSLPIIRWY